MDRNTAPSRLGRKMLFVLGIHLRKVLHVSDESIDLDHLLDGGASSSEDRFDVRDASGCLIPNGSSDQLS